METEERKYSIREFSRESGIPYSTLRALCVGGVDLRESKAGTVYAIAKKLEVPMEELLRSTEDTSFDEFREKEWEKVHARGMGYIDDTIKSDMISYYYDFDEIKKALYVLAMMDYQCRLQGRPLEPMYNWLRKKKLPFPFYAAGVRLSDYIACGEGEEVKPHFIEEFKEHNIFEHENALV